MPPVGLHPELAPGFRVKLEHRRPRAPQIAHQTIFLPVAGLKETQHAPRELRLGGPAKVVPQRTLALLANE